MFDRNCKICQKWCYKGEGRQHVQYQIRQPFQVCGKYPFFAFVANVLQNLEHFYLCRSLKVHNFDIM